MKKVLILHGFTTEYRVPFFKELNRILLERGISIKVVIGQSSKFEQFGEIEDCPFFVKVTNTYFYFGEKYLLWEPVFRYLFGNDMVIMRQANRHLVNPLVFLFCKANGIKIGFWGNLKAYLFNGKRPGKLSLNMQADHWFAYNNLTQKVLLAAGFPEKKITAFQNTIDSRVESKVYQSISSEEVLALKNSLGILEKDIIGIFCSRLYADKRIDFLLRAISLVRKRNPNFKFIVIGDGAESRKIAGFQRDNSSWFHWVGARYGTEKIRYFRVADFQLLPGAVGLHIIDSFALSTPIITTKSKTHGVEIDYLKNLENGVITENNLEAYVEGILEVSSNSSLNNQLIRGCEAAASKYTIENMAYRFADGITKTLKNTNFAFQHEP